MHTHFIGSLTAAVSRRRNLTDLKRDQPHLLVVPPDLVLRAALSLYMEDGSLPMPTPEEMLICNQKTTAEEVELHFCHSRVHVLAFFGNTLLSIMSLFYNGDIP